MLHNFCGIGRSLITFMSTISNVVLYRIDCFDPIIFRVTAIRGTNEFLRIKILL